MEAMERIEPSGLAITERGRIMVLRSAIEVQRNFCNEADAKERGRQVELNVGPALRVSHHEIKK